MLIFFSSISLGRNQVAVGLAPIDFVNKSSESALSVYPVAIANCKERRFVFKNFVICRQLVGV